MRFAPLNGKKQSYWSQTQNWKRGWRKVYMESPVITKKQIATSKVHGDNAIKPNLAQLNNRSKT